ncbi:MAG: hypothetical protein LBV51_05835 [Acholeplasmatales bacterium]|jgi:hypothetical protein|nr:hypothetical protein [Acholeplasmatales bacterium]
MKKVLFVYLILFLSLFIFYTGVVTHEQLKIKNDVREFIKDAKKVYESDTRVYYEVDKENPHPDMSIFNNRNKEYLGLPGDVFVNFHGPYPENPTWNAIFSYYVGGHTALIGQNNIVYESTGFSGEDEPPIDFILYPNSGYDKFSDIGASDSGNYWNNPRYGDTSIYHGYYTNEWAGLRVTNSSAETQAAAAAEAKRIVDSKDEGLYNFVIFLNTKSKYYCGDLVSRAWGAIFSTKDENRKINIAKTSLFVSSFDMMLSNQTYMYLYVKLDDAGRQNVYYLKNNIDKWEV